MDVKPFAESCEQNKEPILAVLKQWFATPGVVLEIGSGTGQHAVYFPRQLPHLLWQASDCEENISGIRLWLEEAKLQNTLDVTVLNVSHTWPAASQYDYVFSANTAHIMSWPEVELLFAGISRVLKPGGLFCLYGPFNYDGKFTSESNARFELWLKQNNPQSGIRDFAALNELAVNNNLRFVDDLEMPVNNRMLAWQKLSD